MRRLKTMFLIFAFCLVGCGPITPAQLKPISTILPRSTSTPNPTATSTAPPTETLEPTATPDLTPSATPTPIPTPATFEEKIIYTFYADHPPIIFTGERLGFDDFKWALHYQYNEVDIDRDGKKEIILSGSYMDIADNQYIAFFVIYDLDNKGQLTERYYLHDSDKSLAKIEFKISSPYIFVDFLTQRENVSNLATTLTRHIVRCEKTCDSLSFTYYYLSFSITPQDRGLYNYVEWHVTKSTPILLGNQIEIETLDYSSDVTSKAEKICYPSGKQEEKRIFTKKRTLKPNTHSKYIWDQGRFIQTDYHELPGIELKGYDKGEYPEIAAWIIQEKVTDEGLSPLDGLKAYYDFFGIPQTEADERSALPCKDVDENTVWYFQSIPTSSYNIGNETRIDAAIEQCQLVIWKTHTEIASNKSTEQVLRHETLTDCDPDFTSFQWINLTGSDIPELAVTSGLYEQQLWIFQIEPNAELLYKTSGYVHGPNLIGVQLQKAENQIQLKIGLPYSSCLDEFSCFSLEKDFDTYIWDDALKSFVLSK